MKQYTTLGIAAIALSSCATYRPVVLHKECVGMLLHKEDTSNYGAYSSRKEKHNMAVVMFLDNNQFDIKEFIDKDIHEASFPGYALTIKYDQLNKIKLRNDHPIDTIPISGENYIKALSSRNYNPKEFEEYDNLFLKYDEATNQKYLALTHNKKYGAYFEELNKIVKLDNKSHKFLQRRQKRGKK